MNYEYFRMINYGNFLKYIQVSAECTMSKGTCFTRNDGMKHCYAMHDTQLAKIITIF